AILHFRPSPRARTVGILAVSIGGDHFVACRAVEMSHSRSDAGSRPCLAKVADRTTVTGEYEVIRILAYHECRQQFAHAGGHVGFSRLAVLRGFERDGICEQVDLSAAHGAQLAQAETEGVCSV